MKHLYKRHKKSSTRQVKRQLLLCHGKRLLVFNKPYGVLCQFSDAEGRKTLGDYIDVAAVYPAGRLDRDSEGLVVLTDDGALQAQIAHPQYKLAKTYWVQVEHQPDVSALDALRRGIVLKDGMTAPAEVRLMDTPKLWARVPPVRYRKTVPTAWLSITLREGRNRQVRRMTAAVGHPTLRLVRVQIGGYMLGDLAQGEYAEIKSL